MLSGIEFVRQSLTLHLFFARIMKEHTLFMQVSLMPRDLALGQQAAASRVEFEKVLLEAISLSNGLVRPEVISSQELVTPYTIKAENATAFLSGIPMDTQITQAEQALTGGELVSVTPGLEQRIYALNQRAIAQLTTLIALKVRVLTEVSVCKMATHVYPLMIDHLIREARFYLETLQRLQKRENVNIEKEEYEEEAQWNRIMGEHAMFIRGMLDPTEVKLINTSNRFANEFVELTDAAVDALDKMMGIKKLTAESLRATEKLRDFKEQGVKGILDCKIKSIILPLLADHVLREANHYIRLLRMFSK